MKRYVEIVASATVLIVFTVVCLAIVTIAFAALHGLQLLLGT